MLFHVSEVNNGYGYTFLIGSESSPTNKLREEIGNALAGLWAGMFEGESGIPEYGFELIPDKSPPTGEKELPDLMPGKTYVIFVLLESESGSAVGEEETTRGILRAIEKSISGSEVKPKIGVITLYNCSIQTLRTKHYAGWGGSAIVHSNPFYEDESRSRWSFPGDETSRRWPR